MAMSFMEKFHYYSRRKSFKYGMPFLVMMIGGSFALKEFTQLRLVLKLTLATFNINLDSHFSYTFSKKVTLKPYELDKAGVDMKPTGEVTLETEYEKIKEIDIEHWENVRGESPAHTAGCTII